MNSATDALHEGSTTMSNTIALTELKTTPVSTALSEIIFGGSSNSYYADPRTRLVYGYIKSNGHGEHVAHVAIARSIDYAGTELQQPLVSSHLASSPVFTVVDDAHDWIAKAERFVVENVRGGEFCATMRDFPVVRETHSYCNRCDRFDTLDTQLLAWGNLTKCTVDGCDFEHYYSIGD